MLFQAFLVTTIFFLIIFVYNYFTANDSDGGIGFVIILFATLASATLTLLTGLLQWIRRRVRQQDK
jgi:hypothetical protein